MMDEPRYILKHLTDNFKDMTIDDLFYPVLFHVIFVFCFGCWGMIILCFSKKIPGYKDIFKETFLKHLGCKIEGLKDITAFKMRWIHGNE